ncbi:2-phospho-L-lactate guanylyltransferase [Microbacterium karelineae]|uniref:2-phospho-L-lactate guanylyltransferase n=1 Tax=Microbacterium karelineae TaxID=2654283 RepID=UPI0012EA23D6|nr:2-phospho-L-lactate guanylyltransferase [Microbacterium karelineae]
MKWSVVIPVKTTAAGKSRLELPDADRPQLALAIALDTIAAAANADAVDEVIVVTGDADVQAGVDQITSARWIPDPGMGLNGAVRAGLEQAQNDARAAMLGDLPALTSRDLDRALLAATAEDRAVVADAENAGSVLVTWRTPATYEPHFGSDSARRHADAGHVLLDIPTTSTVRRDVDTADQMRDAHALGLGPRTSALLEAALRNRTEREDSSAA